jgi:hypothetical protein
MAIYPRRKLFSSIRIGNTIPINFLLQAHLQTMYLARVVILQLESGLPGGIGFSGEENDPKGRSVARYAVAQATARRSTPGRTTIFFIFSIFPTSFFSPFAFCLFSPFPVLFSMPYFCSKASRALQDCCKHKKRAGSDLPTL